MPIQDMLTATYREKPDAAFWRPGSCQDRALGLTFVSPLPPSRVGVDTGENRGDYSHWETCRSCSKASVVS